MKRYYSYLECLNIINEPNRTASFKLYEDNKDLFSKAMGSKTKHQAWEGGYLDHVTETMNIGISLYPVLDVRRKLPFSLSDSILVLNSHDLEKPWKYRINNGCELEFIPEMHDRQYIKKFVDKKLEGYGFQLTGDHKNGLKYIEGEIGEWTPDKILQGPLAAFCHICDVWSARGWYDFPLKEGDSWKNN